MHKIKGTKLARHSSLLNAFVFAPIESFTTDDVWNYLLQSKSPWNSDNRELVTMYRNAQAGECPLVVDKTTPLVVVTLALVVGYVQLYNKISQWKQWSNLAKNGLNHY